jgi:hypothetical protein
LLNQQAQEGLPPYGAKSLPADQIEQYLKLNAGRSVMLS